MLTDREAAFEGALIQAVNKGDLAAAKGLISRKEINDGLVAAVTQGNLLLTKNLLAKGADINVKAKRFGDMTLLQMAVTCRKTKLVPFLLAHKADVNAGNDSGTTPLMAAVMNADVPMVRLLIANKAKVNLRNKEGRSALAYAWSCKASTPYEDTGKHQTYMQIIRILLKAGAKE